MISYHNFCPDRNTKFPRIPPDRLPDQSLRMTKEASINQISPSFQSYSKKSPFIFRFIQKESPFIFRFIQTNPHPREIQETFEAVQGIPQEEGEGKLSEGYKSCKVKMASIERCIR